MSLEEQASTRMMGKGTESKLLLKVCDSLSPSPNPIPCEPTTQGKSVTYVSGTKCYLCLGPLNPEAYHRDVPNALHVLDAGHFALDTATDQIAQLAGPFMK